MFEGEVSTGLVEFVLFASSGGLNAFCLVKGVCCGEICREVPGIDEAEFLPAAGGGLVGVTGLGGGVASI